MDIKRAIFKAEEIDFVSSAETNPADPTIFVLGSITAEEKLVAQTILAQAVRQSGIEDEGKLVKGYLALCKAGLKSIKNWSGFTWTGWTEEVKTLLCETGLVYEIGQKILELNTVGVERKN